MRKNGLALALAAGLSLPAVAFAQSPAGASALEPGQQTRGEITSEDPVNWRDGSRSELFAIPLREGQAVRFTVTGPLSASLSLFLDGELVSISTERDGGGASLVVRAPQDGEYLLAVSGRDAVSFGPYTLASGEQQVYEGGEIQVGASLVDWADTARTIPLRIQHEGIYTIRMDSDEFDTSLSLSGNGVSLANDDANGSNSMLTARLDPGVYQLTLDGFLGQMGGEYQLAVSERELPPGTVLAEGGELVPDRAVTALYQGTEASYRLRVAERSVATITMDSGEIDSRLVLEGEGVREEDDDSGEGLNALVSTVLEPGDYTVRAASFGAGGGVFTLTASLSEVPADAGGGLLEVGVDRDVRMMAGLVDSYRVRIARAGEYVIDMAAVGFDSHLRLLRDGGEVATDDDGGGGLDARIRQTLEAGEYVIEARALGGADGPYSIGIHSR